MLSKTRRDIAILMAFLKEKNEERKLDDIPSEQLNDFLNSSLQASEDFFSASAVN